MSKTVTYAQPIKTTATPAAAEVGPDGKPLPQERPAVSDSKIASILAKFGVQWPTKAQ